MPSDPLTQEIETLQALIAIRGRQAELQECCERAESARSDVSGAVFTRVMADYRERLKALEAEAMPLKIKARDAHGALRISYADVQKANEQAAAEREELIFRCKVGEFDQAVLDTRIQQPEQRLAECAEALKALDERRARFLEAFGGDAALEAFMAQPQAAAKPAPPQAPATQPIPVQTPPPAAPERAAPHDEPETRAVPITFEPPAPPPVPDVGEADRTRMIPIPEASVPLSDTQPVPGSAASDGGEARTMILPAAVVLVHLQGEPDRECPVSAVTTIGRSDHNVICIPRRNISREHASIQASPAGFVLRDHGSQNGTLVNGDTIKECVLADGDIIVIGDAQLDFKLLTPSA